MDSQEVNDRYKREVEIVQFLRSSENILNFLDQQNLLYKSQKDQKQLKFGSTTVASSCFRFYFTQLDQSKENPTIKYFKTSVEELSRFSLISKKTLITHLTSLINAGFFINIDSHELKNDFILEFNPSLISTKKITYDIRYPEKLKDYIAIIESQ